jgi:hypothetical protein
MILKCVLHLLDLCSQLKTITEGETNVPEKTAT